MYQHTEDESKHLRLDLLFAKARVRLESELGHRPKTGSTPEQEASSHAALLLSVALLRVMTEAAGEGVRGLDGLEFLPLALFVSDPASLPSAEEPHIICTAHIVVSNSLQPGRSCHRILGPYKRGFGAEMKTVRTCAFLHPSHTPLNQLQCTRARMPNEPAMSAQGQSYVCGCAGRR